MRLDQLTWYEAEVLISRKPVVLLPTGSTEQHGPMGLIGTDAICAETIAMRAAEKLDCLVAPVLAYTPAPFNMAFPGTVSISRETFSALFEDVVRSLFQHGIRLVYVLNGHGANLEPMRSVAEQSDHGKITIRSWWDFEPVNAIRKSCYGDWEGMHATPSEVAITQAIHRVVEPGLASDPPEKLSAEFVAAHAGDKHGPPAEHRRDFPDGRVGSHSALAKPEHGIELINAAVNAVVEDVERSLSV